MMATKREPFPDILVCKCARNLYIVGNTKCRNWLRTCCSAFRRPKSSKYFQIYFQIPASSSISFSLVSFSEHWSDRLDKSTFWKGHPWRHCWDASNFLPPALARGTSDRWQSHGRSLRAKAAQKITTSGTAGCLESREMLYEAKAAPQKEPAMITTVQHVHIHEPEPRGHVSLPKQSLLYSAS